jgi:hypothetical protein
MVKGWSNSSLQAQEIAVKQCKWAGNAKGTPDASIPSEALVMKQLNQFQCPNILRLENFKTYPKEKVWRFYLEVCPYSDLEELWKGYRKYQWGPLLSFSQTGQCSLLSRHYPPEEFLWHTFHGLAQAALVMGQGPFRDLKTMKPTKRRLLHLDIKPTNGTCRGS